MEQTRRKPGRPRVNLAGDGHGNPILRIRLPQETLALVQAAGGSVWARKVLEQALQDIVPAGSAGGPGPGKEKEPDRVAEPIS